MFDPVPNEQDTTRPPTLQNSEHESIDAHASGSISVPSSQQASALTEFQEINTVDDPGLEHSTRVLPQGPQQATSTARQPVQTASSCGIPDTAADDFVDSSAKDSRCFASAVMLPESGILWMACILACIAGLYLAETRFAAMVLRLTLQCVSSYVLYMICRNTWTMYKDHAAGKRCLRWFYTKQVLPC